MATTRLSHRTGAVTLPAASPDAEPVFQDLLRAEAGAGAWRIVEAFSDAGLPFELRAAWTSGDGAGQSAWFTVGRATRFAVFAASVSLQAANLADRGHRVGCVVPEGYCVSANQYAIRATGQGETPVTAAIPPFATHLRLDCADPAQLSACTLALLDGFGVLRAAVRGDQQPSSGLPVAGAASVQLTAPSELRLRGVFHLSI